MRVANAVFVLVSLAILLTVSAAPQAPSLPAQVSDAEFWRIFTEFSEPGGNIRPTRLCIIKFS